MHPITIKIIETSDNLLALNPTNSHNEVKVKNILACTNLSKLNNSNQCAVGTYLPGVQHSTKMIIVHKMAKSRLYFKSSFIIKGVPADNSVSAVYYC